MAHYALIDDNNIVVQVITGVDEDVIQIDSDGTPVGGSSEAWEDFYASQSWHAGLRCKRTSYNSNIRKQFAGIGFTYDDDADVFIARQPYPSWSLDDDYDWQPPTPKPDGDYIWNEAELEWVAI